MLYTRKTCLVGIAGYRAMRLFSISGLLLLLASAALADAVDDVRCNEIRFSQSVGSQNLELFRSFIDTDARFVGSEVSRGRDEVVGGACR